MQPNFENPFRPSAKRATKRLFKVEPEQATIPLKNTKTRRELDKSLENKLVKYGPHVILFPQWQFLKKVEKLIPKEVIEKKTHIQQAISEIIEVENGNIIKIDFKKLGLIKIPPEIGQLTKLQVFHCGDNRLEELPIEINQLSNLQKLYCDWNRIHKLLSKIDHLTNLQELSCYNNKLSIREKIKIKSLFPFALV